MNKWGNALELDDFPVECITKGGMAVLEWLLRLLNVTFDMWVVPIWTVHVQYPCPKGRVTSVNVVTIIVC